MMVDNGVCEKCGSGMLGQDVCINCAVARLGAEFAEALAPTVKAIEAFCKSFPDEKQLARKRSRDDMNIKRKGLHRGNDIHRRM